MEEQSTIKPTGNKPTILVIEDNADQWFLIRWVLLQQFPEVDAIWQSNPSTALLYLESCIEDGRLPRLIILDLYLPRAETGWQTLNLLKDHPVYGEVPVVVLSQSSDPKDVKESYLQRANSYIAKPGSYQEWLASFARFRHYWWEVATLPKPV